MERCKVKTESGAAVRVARVRQEIVMTSLGYAQPATISLGGRTVRGYVQTAGAEPHLFFVDTEAARRERAWIDNARDMLASARAKGDFPMESVARGNISSGLRALAWLEMNGGDNA